ncbi:MAG: aminopeptidase P family protein [Chitinophagales bacterium]
MFETRTYIERRQKLKKDIGAGLILLLGNEETGMSYKDNCYPFRQDSSFLYFFGIDRPGLAAVLDIDNNREMIFGDDLSVEQMVWTGYQEPLQLQSDRVGVSQVYPSNQLPTVVQPAARQGRKIHFLPPYRAEHQEKLSFLLDTSLKTTVGKHSIDLIKVIVSQRSNKSAGELDELEKAVDLTIDMQLAALQFGKEGISEAQVAGKMHSVALGAGGNLAFPIILTANGQILHNHYSTRVLQGRELVLSDCGAETPMHYCGDLTRTFPVNGTFTTKQREIYEIVLNAHEAAINKLRPGRPFKEVHLFACEKLVDGLQQLGLMKGDKDEAVAAGAHTVFFPCGLGHMLGLDTHDMENLGEQYVGYTDQLQQSTQFGLRSLRLGRPLEPGFVITVEPGLYFIPSLIDLRRSENKFLEFINYDKLDEYKDFGGIRIEENFCITADAAKLLGKNLPRTVRGIETLRNSLTGN